MATQRDVDSSSAMPSSGSSVTTNPLTKSSSSSAANPSSNPSHLGIESCKLACSHTEYKTLKYHHLWTIKNYMYFKDKEEPIKSPKFRTPEGSEWYLRLHPLGFQKDVPNRNYISVYLCLHHPPGNENTVHAKHRGKLLPADENVQELVKYMERSATQGKVDCFNKDNFSWGWPEFTSHRDLLDENKKFMRDGNLQVLWYMEILEETFSYTTPTYDVPVPTLAADLGKLFRSFSTFTDFRIHTQDDNGQPFHVHKAILSARNKYFEAMFSHDTREKRENEVALADTQETIQNVLQFIYTDEINTEDLFINAENLLAASEKYQIPRLKSLCEKELLTKMDFDSAPRLFLYGDLYNSTLLKNDALNFFRCHRKEVTNSQGFRELLTDARFVQLLPMLTSTT